MNFESLFKEHKDLVYNLALQYVQNSEDAEEITHDVFLIVYEKLNTFRQDAKMSTWLYRITINKSLDFIKSKKRKRRFAFFTSLFSPETNEPMYNSADFNHPGVILEQREEMQQLFGFINQLPENQKTVLILLKIEMKTQKEVADIMQLSMKAVESLMQRAKMNLSKKIKSSEGK